MVANGAVPASNLTTVQGSMQLTINTAAAWRALVADVQAATGVTLTISSPGGAYRSLAMQADMVANPSKYGANHGVAAPGNSVHGYGTCVDIYNWAAVGTARLDAYAAARGFTRTISSEPWHYQHNGTTTASTEEDDMYTDDDRKRDAEILALLKEQQKRNLSAFATETLTLLKEQQKRNLSSFGTEILTLLKKIGS